MTYRISYEDKRTAEWDTYVNSHPEATNYHLYDWQEVVKKSFGHDNYLVAVRDATGAVCGVLPLVHMQSRLFGNFLISLPYFNYGGLLCDDTACETLLLQEAEKIKTTLNAEYVELRHQRLRCPGLPAKTHKMSMILDLESNEEAQWKKFEGKLRNNVRRASKNMLTATVGHLELLDDFYEVFCRNMRDLGTPVYSKDFFRNILRTFPDTTKILSVQLDGKTAASGIMTWFRDTLEVPWASSNRDFKQFYPNYLLYWEAIRFAIQKGARKFDFGRSTYGEGPYNFKKQWRPSEVPLFWHYVLNKGESLPELNTHNPKYRMAIRMWKCLPVLATKVIGPRIVRNIP